MKRWLQLSWAERWMLFAAALATTVARAALLVVPWSRIAGHVLPRSASHDTQQACGGQAPSPAPCIRTGGTGEGASPPQNRRVPLERQRGVITCSPVSTHRPGARDDSVLALVSWALAVCARRLPWATCLSNALAARWLLARRGIGVSIELGTYATEGRPHFHARAVCGGREIAGHREMVVLASLGA